MTWIESKNECLAIEADLPYITLKDQNKEIGDFPGVMLIFDVNLTYYRYLNAVILNGIHKFTNNFRPFG